VPSDKKHENLGYWMSCISRLSYAFIKKRLHKTRLRRGQFFFLKILSKNDGMSQNELSDLLSIDKATTARAIKRLLLSGYVRKTADPSDRRVNRLYLTTEGRKVCIELQQISEELEEHLLEGFSSEEKHCLFEFLKRMVHNALDT